MDSDSLPERKLNPRQAAFVAEYLIDLNGTQAAIRAGYSPATAAVQASQLLTDLNIAAAVERGKAQRLSRVNTTADSVLHEMSLLAQSCVEHYVVSDDGYLRPAPDAPEGVMRAVQSVDRKSRVFKDKDGTVLYVEYEIKFKLWDKPGQLKLMGKHANVAACFDSVRVAGHDGGALDLSKMPIDALKAELASLAADAEKLA